MRRRIGVTAAPPQSRFNEVDIIAGVPTVYNPALVGMCNHHPLPRCLVCACIAVF
jgi:hypothetical protein